MQQTNPSSGKSRNIKRAINTAPKIGLPDPAKTPDALVRQLSGGATTSRVLDSGKIPTLPADIDPLEVLLVRTGQVIQVVRKHEWRGKEWWRGNVLYTPTKIDVAAGWFPACLVQTADGADMKKIAGAFGGSDEGLKSLDPPPTWSKVKDPSKVELVKVTNSQEKMEVEQFFLSKIGGKGPFNVVKVERVQNLALWQTYVVKKKTMLARKDMTRKPDQYERKWLFHGSRADVILPIAQQGFNRAFAGFNATAYGKGVYFARDSSYSCSPTYSRPDKKGVQRMFLCRVSVGEYCVGKSGALVPDARPGLTNVLHDTTVDNVSNPSIFVAYHDAQAYPEYLVHFKK